jgi:hypothetical protein
MGNDDAPSAEGSVLQVRGISGLRSVTVPVANLQHGRYLLRLQGKNGSSSIPFNH